MAKPKETETSEKIEEQVESPTDILKVSEAAAFLRINSDSMQMLLESGAIEFGDVRRPGSKRPSYRILRQSLIDFVNKKKEVAAPAKRNRRRKKNDDDQLIEFYK